MCLLWCTLRWAAMWACKLRVFPARKNITKLFIAHNKIDGVWCDAPLSLLIWFPRQQLMRNLSAEYTYYIRFWWAATRGETCVHVQSICSRPLWYEERMCISSRHTSGHSTLTPLRGALLCSRFLTHTAYIYATSAHFDATKSESWPLQNTYISKLVANGVY